MKRVRKPLGRVWCGNLLQVDIILERYGVRSLRELHSWLGKVLAWNEQGRKRRAKR